MHRKSFFTALLIFYINISFSSPGLTRIDEDTIIIAGKNYKAGLFKKIFLGSHYRKEWITPLSVSVLNFDTLKGGLKAVKQGGSRQTTNLRLVDSLGRQYVIRSVDKSPTRNLPPDFQNTLAADVVQDQTSAEHPYSLLVLPDLAKAAGIYHTNPQLYVIANHPALGEYASTFTGMLVYFEERPDEDMSYLSSVGNTKNAIGTEKLFEKLYKDPDNFVDEKFYLKSRLFDMWIGDWGRHEDNWRWAEFKIGDCNMYRPIPRDRDHTFFRFDGIIPHLGSRKWAFRQFVNFDHKYKNLSGLNRSATSLDRAILNSLSEEEWLQIANDLKNSLTDEVIVNAFTKMPATIYALHGDEIVNKLKSRRDRMTVLAEKYYKELYTNVDITGTNKDESYFIKRINNETTEVLAIKRNNPQDTIYLHHFKNKETKEIRIFGLEGNDEFYITGKTKKGPQIRLIGGEGDDKFSDQSSVSGCKKRNIIYDNESTELIKNNETNDQRSDHPGDSINQFRRNIFDYDFSAVMPSFEFNPDDALFIGLSFYRKTYGFRKSPHSSLQRARINYSTSTSAISIRYLGEFKKFIGKWNLLADGKFFGPKYAWNYFGFGNESIYADSSIQYFRIRAVRISIEPIFYRNLTKAVEFGVGPQYEYVNIQRTTDRFIAEPGAIPDESGFKGINYAGVLTFLKISTLDNLVSTKNGLRWYTEAGTFDRLENNKPYININSNLSIFYTPKLPVTITFATRIGAATNFGDFIFYRGNTLGGSTNLRGYRRTRFYGRSSAYHNNEIRITVLETNLYLFPAKIGLIGFYDYGRVWADNEKSNKIHSGYGPGIFIQAYNRSVLSATYGFSEDNGFVNIQIGFLF